MRKYLLLFKYQFFLVLITFLTILTSSTRKALIILFFTHYPQIFAPYGLLIVLSLFLRLFNFEGLTLLSPPNLIPQPGSEHT